MRRVAVTVLVLVLLGGTAAAFTVTEALKLERPPLRAAKIEQIFSPTCGCSTRSAKLLFQLRHADRLDLVITSDGEPVRTLLRDLDTPAGRVRVRWDGRDDADAIVPDGAYHLRVHLQEADRTIVIPNEIRVDTEAPSLTDVSGVTPDVFSPDGDGRRDSITVSYRTNETGQALVFVEGRLAVETRLRRRGEHTVVWDGSVDGRSLREGIYAPFVRVRDRAGNMSTAAKLSVEIRYLDVFPRIVVAARGTRMRFRVLTDASSVSWALRNPAGRVVLADARTKPGSVTARLPDRIHAGRYVLQVSANGHRERVVVRVTRRG